MPLPLSFLRRERLTSIGKTLGQHDVPTYPEGLSKRASFDTLPFLLPRAPVARPGLIPTLLGTAAVVCRILILDSDSGLTVGQGRAGLARVLL